MLETFNTILKIDATVIGNQTIEGLKKFPLLKHLYSPKLYKSETLLLIFALLGFLFKSFKQMAYNFAITFGFMVIPLLFVLLKDETYNLQVYQLYLCVLFTMPLIALITSESYKATESKYTNVFLLKLKAKDYFYIEIIKNTITNLILMFLPILLVLFIVGNIQENLLLLMIFYCISSIFINMIQLYLYYKKDLILRDNDKLFILVIITGLLIPSLLLYIGLYIMFPLFITLIILILIISIYLINKLNKTQIIEKLYKRKFSNFNNVVDEETIMTSSFEKQSRIELVDQELYKEKQGYELFNDLFFSRHKELIHDSIKGSNIIMIGLIVIVTIITYFIDEIKPYIKEFIEYRYLYLSLFIFMSNKGIEITKAMFFHCDQHMLNYNFYRTKNNIFNLYKMRLKSMIKYNISTAILLILSLNILNIVAGSTNIIYVLCISISTLFLSMFFSIYYLSLYFILQPYSKNMKNRNIFYNTLLFLTVYLFMTLAQNVVLKLPILTLSIITSVLIISIILIILVMIKAPNNFKIK